MNKEVIIIERGEDGSYSAYPSTIIDTIIGEGSTADEAKEDFLNSFDEVVKCYIEKEGYIPDYLRELDFDYKII